MKENQHQLSDSTPIWPMAVHWFVNGWMLPEAMIAGIEYESSYIPGSHARLLAGVDVPVVRGSDGTCWIALANTSLLFEIADPAIGSAEHNFMVSIRSEDSIEILITEVQTSLENAIAQSIEFIVDAFLREMGGVDEAMEFIEFAAEHYPKLLDQEVVLQAFLEAAESV